jgi:hypothetical protein
VARSGRVYDIAESATAAAPPAAARRSYEPAQTVAPPPPSPPPAPSRPVEASWPTGQRMREDAPRQRSLAAAPPPPQPAPQREQSSREQSSRDHSSREHVDQGGWLSDLLARASRDEPPATRPHGAPARQKPSGALDTLTLDIARMVDQTAVTDLWERFQRGEKAPFGRRLYTPQGQQTFEEIRRRYRVDAEFRGTVDHYITEFERLLMETGRNDRDGALTRGYLISDAGKVYTMLGHASGRFE